MATIVTRASKGSALTHTQVDANFTNLNTDKIERNGSITYTGKQTFATPTTSIASIVLPHGTAPTAPVNGDTWTTTAGLFSRINGVTQQAAFLSGGTFTGTVTAPGLRLGVTTRTGAYTAAATDYLILCNATTAAFAVTLPTAVGVTGLMFVIKKIDSSANAITVNTTSSQTIDGASTYSLPAQWNFVNLQSDGANWMRVG